jgi:hypothetical protein
MGSTVTKPSPPLTERITKSPPDIPLGRDDKRTLDAVYRISQSLNEILAGMSPRDNAQSRVTVTIDRINLDECCETCGKKLADDCEELPNDSTCGDGSRSEGDSSIGSSGDILWDDTQSVGRAATITRSGRASRPVKRLGVEAEILV